MRPKLFLYNALTRKKDLFKPAGKIVKIYVCGPTVYQRAHIGNARPVVVFDMLFRLLKVLFDDVLYVRNITDVDDKIIQAARVENESIETLTKRVFKWFKGDMGALGSLSPSIEPKATEHIEDMIGMIQHLLERDLAYVAPDQKHVLFHVKHFSGYGKLSGRKQEDQKAGLRPITEVYKKNSSDFVLWKPSNKDEPGWESPWGRGRPGWHIECSAMSHRYLGVPFDIHGGGQDLLFPHHENERAQTCGCFSVPEMCFFWMHNGMLRVEGEKMSKTLGNVLFVNDLLKKWSGAVLRWVIMSTHYRKPLDWTNNALQAAEKNISTLKKAILLSDVARIDQTDAQTSCTLKEKLIQDFLCDDMNTPGALAHLLGEAKKAVAEKSTTLAWQVKEACLFLGLDVPAVIPQEEKKNKIDADSLHQRTALSQKEIDNCIAQRTHAKKQGDFAKADMIRDQLHEAGIALKDTPQGNTTWSRCEKGRIS